MGDYRLIENKVLPKRSTYSMILRNLLARKYRVAMGHEGHSLTRGGE